MLTDKEIEYIILSIYSGRLSVYNLPENLYFSISEYLKKGLYEGIGSTEIFSVFEQELIVNVQIFSAAKTFNYVLDTNGLIIKNGKIVPFDIFKSEAMQVYKVYNETWLETEYLTAIGQGQNIAQWKNFITHPDAGEYLMYDAVLDAATSNICRPLDGIVRHINDPFWKTYMPLNHYRCRCTVRQIDPFENIEETNDMELINKTKEVDLIITDAFKQNAGITGKIFSDDHPYFDIPLAYKKLARNNFNLPINE